MLRIHTENLPESDPYFILGVVDTLAYGELAAIEEEELSQECSARLTEICDSVSAIVPEFEADLGDFAADLEEGF